MSKLAVNYPDPGFWTKTSWIQIGYGVWVNLTGLSIGLVYGFSAVTLPQLGIPDSTILVTTSQETWIASVLNLSSPIGCLINGYVMDKFGRKIALVICEVPTCVGWLYISCAKSASDIIIGRIISGIGVGMAVVPPRVYTSEITLPNMRGFVGAFSSLAIAIGITIQAGLGSVMYWRTLSYICSGYEVVVCTINLFLPETPYYLVMKNNIDGAKKCIKRIRSSNYNVELELDDILDFKDNNEISKLSTKAQIQALFTAAACKSFWIIFCFVVIAQLSGANIIITWTVDILETSQTTTNAYTGNVMLGITRVASAILAAILLYKCGKRHLTFISCIGVVTSCIAIFIHLNSGSKNIFPVICWMSYIVFSSIGLYSLPYLIMSELYPLQIRGLLCGISISITNILIFLSLKYFPKFRNLLGFNYTVLTFGLCSFIGFVILYFILPETNNLTLQEIEEYFNKLRPTLTSQRAQLSKQILQESERNLPSLNTKDKTKEELAKLKSSQRKSLRIVNSSKNLQDN